MFRNLSKLLGRLATEENSKSERTIVLRAEFSAQLVRLIEIVRPYTLVDEIRLAALYGLMLEVSERGVEGHVVECGVGNGGSAAIIASAINKDVNRHLWLYDTFTGLPKPSPLDGNLAQEYVGKIVGSVDKVKEVLGYVDFPLERVHIKKGLFEETFGGDLPERVAFLHIDADWYESVLIALRRFYPLLQDGGVVIIDDFGHWEGAREAFYDFCSECKIKPLLERVGYTQAFWRKGRTHNRGIPEQYRVLNLPPNAIDKVGLLYR